MKYIEVKINTTVSQLLEIETRLLELGIFQYIINDPREIEELLKKKHSYDWDFLSEEVLAQKDKSPEIIIYFDDDKKGLVLFEQLKKEFPDLTYQIRDDKEWKDKWKEYFVPTKITERLVINPYWCDYEKKKDEVVLKLNPGMAFGTGTHETTSMCIKLIEKYLKPGMKVLDVGTGTGILAIAAKLLGGGEVVAIDIDDEAVIASRENIRLNQTEVLSIKADLTKGVEFTADIMVANLVADLNVQLAESAHKHLSKDGIYISSGILIEQEEKVADAIREKGFEIIEITEDGLWCAITAKRK